MPEITTLIIVFIVGLLSSILGAMVGSGGLISIPMLIIFGLPTNVSIATNKFGGVGLSIGAIIKFYKEKKINWKYVPQFLLISLVGAVIGSYSLLWINKELLDKLVGIIILIMLVLFLIDKKLGLKKIKTSKAKKMVGYFVYFLITIFGAFFGGGAGTLIIYSLTYFFGFTLIESNATDIVPWFFLCLFSLIILSFNGVVDYYYGITLFLGMLIGGYIGAHIAVKKGNKWVKAVFTIVAFLSAIKIMFF